jgi:peptidoglycan/LPS O-acetylase OafA/YrhL
VGFVALALWLPALLSQGRDRLARIYPLTLVTGAVAAAGFLVTYPWMLSG